MCRRDNLLDMCRRSEEAIAGTAVRVALQVMRPERTRSLLEELAEEALEVADAPQLLRLQRSLRELGDRRR